MKTRLIILVFSMPLFMALAGLNGALLYFQERSESASAMNEQALSAAIAAAEFASSLDNPESVFSDPSRSKAIAAAARHIKDLDGFYLIDRDNGVSALSPASTPWPLDDLSRPSNPTVMAITPDTSTHPYVVALAPAGVTSFIAVRLDASPMVARLATLRSHILLIVCISGIIGAILAWQVSRRITRDLAQNREAIDALEAGEASGSAENVFAIREARELADAVQLMYASQRAAAKRLDLEATRQDRERTHDSSVLKYRKSVFGPFSQRIVGADVAVRLFGDAPAGCFFVVCSTENRAIVVAGRCVAKVSVDAFALALAARRYLEDNLLTGNLNECLELAKTAFNVEELEYAEWRTDEPLTPGVRFLAIADAEIRQKTERFSLTDPNAAPTDMLDSIETLLMPAGVFAAVRRADAALQDTQADGDGDDQS